MANNSGVKQEVFNNLERLLSTDLNRLQAFQSAALMQALKYLHGRKRGGSPSGSGITESSLTPDATPLQGSVLGGLTLLIGATTITIEPGMVIASSATSQGDDDADMLFGLLTASPTVAFTANAGPSFRWDVIEIYITPKSVLEVASRAEYNTSTRVFANTALTKVDGSTVSVRIRTGTPGSDPTFAAGWMPVAMVHHPGATTSFADVNVFDVRPLVDDETSGLPSGQIGYSPTGAGFYERMLDASVNVTTNWAAGPVTCVARMSADVVSSGWNVAGWYFPQYRTRGIVAAIQPSGAGETLAPNLYAGAPAVGANGFYFAANILHARNRYMGVSLMFPWSLPRWVLYSRAGIGLDGRRLPQGCGGILCLHDFSTGAQLPAAFSTSGGTHPRVTIGAVWSHATVDGFCAQISTEDGWVYMETDDLSSTPSNNGTRYVAGAGTAIALTRGNNLPSPSFPVTHATVALSVTNADVAVAPYLLQSSASRFIYPGQAYSEASTQPPHITFPLNREASATTYTSNQSLGFHVVTGYRVLHASKV